MKKIIIWTFIFLFSLNISFAQYYSVEKLGESTTDVDRNALGQAGTDMTIANFTATHNYIIRVVWFFISERTVTPFNFNVSIYNCTSNAAVLGTRLNKNATLFGTDLTQGNWYNATNFSVNITAGKTYCVVFHGAGGGGTGGYYRLGETQGDSSATGNCQMTSSGGEPTSCTPSAQTGVTTISINLTGENVSASAGTTPPSITYYNLTNENGCENWITNKSNPCSTSSVTPTVQFNTSEPAWCAIAAARDNSSLNKNYSDMGSSRNCTGAMAGEGGTNHRCTLTNLDELIYETSYLFISCKDADNNQNSNSTSDALSLNITSLETTAGNSIELGIRNALSSGYSTYTNQRIYARNSASTQSTGRFDKVVKKLSKIWAFNRIGISDVHVNMFNITPVLYTLEFANKTSVYIENQTALLINATK